MSTNLLSKEDLISELRTNEELRGNVEELLSNLMQLLGAEIKERDKIIEHLKYCSIALSLQFLRVRYVSSSPDIDIRVKLEIFKNIFSEILKDIRALKGISYETYIEILKKLLDQMKQRGYPPYKPRFKLLIELR